MTLKVIFAGTPDFAAAHLKGLLDNGITPIAVITQPDKPGKRGKKPVFSEVKKLAVSHDLTILQPAKLTTEALAEYPADLMVVVAYGQILRTPVLSFPRLGCINVHASLLPRWRGAAPIQRAILAGDKHSGVCIMQMDKGLDTGDVLSRVTVPIAATDNSDQLASKLINAAIPDLVGVIAQLEQGTAEPVKQIEAGMTYAKKIDKQEAQCNWSASSDTITQQIRGFNPDPVCFTQLGELRVKLYEAVTEPEFIPATVSQPGEILEVTKKGVLVACAGGAVRVKKLQLPLGKGSILSGADILNARSDIIHPGAVFSQS